MNSLQHPRMVVLGSGSSGNATAITDGDSTILIDCGFSAREVAKRLQAVGIEPSSVSALLVTHEHGDHIRGIDVFCRRHAPECMVCATERTWRASGLAGSRVEWQRIERGATFTVGALEVTAFRTSHDAADPVGFRVRSAHGVVGVATDTGELTPEALEALSGCTVLALESNHDIRMLETGPYPAFLKQRIRSTRGHLSNGDAANAVEALAHDGLLHVVGMHRSNTNNTQRLVSESLGMRVQRIGLKAQVTVAGQDVSWDSHPPQGCLFG